MPVKIKGRGVGWRDYAMIKVQAIATIEQPVTMVHDISSYNEAQLKVIDMEVKEGEAYEIASGVEASFNNVTIKGRMRIKGALDVYNKVDVIGILDVIGELNVGV